MSFAKETNITLFFTVLVLIFTNGLCYFRWQEAKDQLRFVVLDNESVQDRIHYDY